MFKSAEKIQSEISILGSGFRLGLLLLGLLLLFRLFLLGLRLLLLLLGGSS